MKIWKNIKIEDSFHIQIGFILAINLKSNQFTYKYPDNPVVNVGDIIFYNDEFWIIKEVEWFRPFMGETTTIGCLVEKIITD